MFSTVKNPEISIVIPAFNEEGNILPLIASIRESCALISYEILLIDDGSRDKTLWEAQEASKITPALRVIPLKGNFGQTAAMAAGIDLAKGTIIIPMDADGQNDPADIPILKDKFNEGFDVVSGWRKDRKDRFINRRLPSWLANTLISVVTGVHLHDYGCTLKAYRASMIKNVQLSGEMHRFLPAWCTWMGGKTTEIPVRHHPRTRGQSKYGIFRVFKVIIDLITIKFFSGYLTKPNYLFTGGAMVLLAVGFFTGCLAILDKIFWNMFPAFRIPLLLLCVFLGLAAIFLVFLGLLSELLVRLYFSVRNQKPYVLNDEKSV